MKTRAPSQQHDLRVDLSGGGHMPLSGGASAPFINVKAADGAELVYANARRLFTTSRRTMRAQAASAPACRGGEATGASSWAVWSEEEDGLLFAAVARLGMGAWAAVADELRDELASSAMGASTASDAPSQASASSASGVSEGGSWQHARAPKTGSECQRR